MLYVGVTNNLECHLQEHKQTRVAGFRARYHVNRLVCAEHYADVTAVIARKKRVKLWRRVRKVTLVEAARREWNDLSTAWE